MRYTCHDGVKIILLAYHYSPHKKQTRTRLKKHVPVDVNWWTHSMCPYIINFLINHRL